MPLPPGLSGFVQGQQLGNQNQAHELQQAMGLMGVLAQMQRQKQVQAQAAQEQELRGALSQLPPDATPEMVTRAITPYAKPDTLLQTFQRAQDLSAQREMTAANSAAQREVLTSEGQARREQSAQLQSERLEQQRELAKQRSEDQRLTERERNQARMDMMRFSASLRQGSGGGSGRPPPVGYRYTPDGNLEPIPGGPAAAKVNPAEAGVAGETAGKVSMADQAIVDIRETRRLLFDKDGNLNRKIVAAMNVPFTAGMPGNTDARMAYSKLYNAVEAKLRIETGAAATTREVESIVRRFIPSMLDSKETAADKLNRLEIFMSSTLDQVKGIRRDKLRSGGGLVNPAPASNVDSLLKKYE